MRRKRHGERADDMSGQLVGLRVKALNVQAFVYA